MKLRKLLYLLPVLLLAACVRFDDDVDTSTVNFSEPSSTVEEGKSGDLLLKFNKPIPEESTIVLSWSSENAQYGQDFITVPDGHSGSILLSPEIEQDSVILKFITTENQLVEGDKLVRFSLVFAEGNLETGDTDPVHSVTISENDEITIRVNEFHYDDDQFWVTNDPFVEILVSGADLNPTTLSEYRIILYRGDTGEYLVPGDQEQSSTTFENLVKSQYENSYLYVWEKELETTQSGIAISGPNGLMEFVSYEGTFVGSEGVATGIESTDVGEAEDGNTDPNSSLQRKANNTWMIANRTKGNLNTE